MMSAKRAKPSSAGAGAGGTSMLQMVLDSARTLVTVAFGLIGIIFLLVNWNKLTDVISGVSRFEAFGFKVEVAKKSNLNFDVYQSLVASADEPGRKLTKPQFDMIQLRAAWAQPVLDTARILWVDDEPERNNPEMTLLAYHRVSIHLARSTEQAMDLLSDPELPPFHLVVTDVFRPQDEKKELTNCPVYWFKIPFFAKNNYGTAELREFNRLYNNKADAGFVLADQMNKDLKKIKDAPSPIIFHGYYYRENEANEADPKVEHKIANACSRVVTATSFDLINSIFDHLITHRWREFEKYSPLEKPLVATEKPVSPPIKNAN